MHDYQIRAGDRLPPLECELLNGAGVPAENIAGATVELKYRLYAGGAVITRAVTVVDVATARVKYEWVAGETDTAGDYLAYFVVTFADGRKESFPNQKLLRLGMVAPL